MHDLSDEYVTLRSISKNDTSQIVAWRNCDFVRFSLFSQSLITEEDHKKYFDEFVKTGRCRQYIIHSKKLNKSVGTTFLKKIDDENRKAEIGIFIGNTDATGIGIGHRALKLICEFGFSQLNLDKIYAQILDDNMASIRCFAKAGFILETKECHSVIINNITRKVIVMMRIRS